MLEKQVATPLQGSKRAFRKEWFAVLEAAVREVFSLMAGIDLVGPASADPGKAGEVVAMVGLAGELCGLLTVRCSHASAVEIACHMLGVAEEDAIGHAADAVGEICNMVAGGFKAKIDGLEDRCMLSVPTVIIGSNYEVHSLATGNRIEMTFSLSGRALGFLLEIRG